MAHKDSVKILFYLQKDEDGYPPVEVESVWAIPKERDYEINSIPFYVKGIALGDLVRADPAEDGALEFRSVLRRSGHSTYRILLLKKDTSDPQKTIDELIRLGLSVESDLDILLSVDVPPDIDESFIRSYLFKGIDEGRWEVEEAFRYKLAQ